MKWKPSEFSTTGIVVLAVVMATAMFAVNRVLKIHSDSGAFLAGLGFGAVLLIWALAATRATPRGSDK